MTTDTDIPGTIERSIDIDAPAEVVWELVSEPGWFINDGAIVEHEIREEGDHLVVVDPTHGPFPVTVVALEPPRRAVFRWLTDGDNTVEFTIADRPGGVTLTVLERGFALGTPEQRRRNYESNVEGWRTELALARDWCAARS